MTLKTPSIIISPVICASHWPSSPRLFIYSSIWITTWLIYSVLRVAVATLIECALPRAILRPQWGPWDSGATVWQTRWTGWGCEGHRYGLWRRRGAWKVTLVMNRVEDVLYED